MQITYYENIQLSYDEIEIIVNALEYYIEEQDTIAESLAGEEDGPRARLDGRRQGPRLRSAHRSRRHRNIRTRTCGRPTRSCCAGSTSRENHRLAIDPWHPTDPRG